MDRRIALVADTSLLCAAERVAQRSSPPDYG